MIINVLFTSFRFIWLPILRVYGDYKYKYFTLTEKWHSVMEQFMVTDFSIVQYRRISHQWIYNYSHNQLFVQRFLHYGITSKLS